MSGAIDAPAFARAWCEAWNRRDVEAVLAHFTDNVSFTSARAEPLTGSPRVQGKAALRAYWTRALEGIRELQFALDHAVWDAARRELAIVYVARIDEKRVRALELYGFDGEGRVVVGEAFYGGRA